MVKENKKKEGSMSEKREGVSVQEIESFAKEYTNEILIVLAIIIGTISSIFDWFTGPRLSLMFIAIFGIITAGLPVPVLNLQKMLVKYLYKQNTTMQTILGVVRIVLAIFLPFILFAEMGFLAGAAINYYMQKPESKKHQKQETASTENEEEHI